MDDMTLDVATTDQENNQGETREEKFIRALFTYNNVREAGKYAGYSPAYVNSGNFYRKLKNPKFQEQVRQYAIAHGLLNIPRICRIEDAVLTHLEANPLDVPKYQRTLKEIKQVSGLLQPDDQATKTPTIRISNVQNLMLQLHQHKLTNGNDSRNED